MGKIKTKLLVFFFVGLAFAGPTAAVIAWEKSKRAESIVNKQEEIAQAKKDSELARYQYYLDIADQKNNLKQAMEESKAQYEQLLSDQPGLVKAKQTTVQQTVIQPVVTRKVVNQQVPVTSSSTPKSSTKTKTS